MGVLPWGFTPSGRGVLPGPQVGGGAALGRSFTLPSNARYSEIFFVGQQVPNNNWFYPKAINYTLIP